MGTSRKRLAVAAGHVIEQLESRTMLSIPEPNETLATAFRVDGGIPFSGKETFSDFAGDSDQRDFYRLNIPSGGVNFNIKFTARLYNLSADLQLALIRDSNNNGVIDNNEIFQLSTNAGISEELITRSGTGALLHGDNYYIEVYRGNAGNNSNYSLDLISDSAGDTPTTARELIATGGHSVNEYLDNVDDLFDLFAVDLDNLSFNGPGTLSARLVALTATNYHVDLFQDLNGNNVLDSGEMLTTSRPGDADQEIISFPVNTNSGHRYYLKVLHSAPASENYTLRTLVDNAGNTLATAHRVSRRIDGDLDTFKDEVGTGSLVSFTDPDDYYRFTLQSSLTFFAQLDLDADTGPSGFQATAQLFRDSNGNGVFDSTETLATATTDSNGRARIQKALTSGDYFVRVSGSPFPNYTLQVHGDTIPGVINTGDSLSNSKDIGQQLGQHFQGESMGAGDPSDTFKLSIPVAGRLTARLDVFQGIPNTFAGSVISDANHNGIFDAGETIGTFDTTTPFDKSLAAGTYYVRLLGGTGTYDLFLTTDFAGDTPATPRNLGTLGAFVRADDFVSNSSPVDVDYYKFNLASSQTFTASIIDSPEAVVTLYQDSGGGVLTQLQQVTATNGSATLQRSLSAGNYQVLVSTTSFFSGNYAIGFSTGDNDDSIPEADVTRNNWKNFGDTGDFTLTSATDVDMIGFEGDAGQVVAINIDSRNGSSVDTFLRLFDSAGHQVAFNDNGAAPGETASKFSYLTFLMTTSDNYYFGVSSAGNNNYNPNDGSGDAGGSSFGQYHFSLTEMAPVAAAISGKVFNDLNGNGIIDSGEAGLSGRTVYIDANNNVILDAGEKSTTTDASGNYSLTNLTAGTYKVRQILPTGWSQTIPLNGFGINATVSNGQTLANQNFGAKQTSIGNTASIAGNLFDDVNGNLAKDSTETGIGGRTVYLDVNNNSIKDTGEVSVTTDSSGNYKFSNLAAGTYKVREILPSGWSQTTPTSNFGIGVTLTSGQAVSGKNFGSRTTPAGTASISGNVFHDFNRNGVKETGDTGIGGWLLYIDSNNNNVMDTNEQRLLTDSSGNYKFINLAAGTYKVREVLQSGYVQTIPTSNFAQTVTVTSGQTVTGKNFGVDN